jgi:hypothetical protein
MGFAGFRMKVKRSVLYFVSALDNWRLYANLSGVRARTRRDGQRQEHRTMRRNGGLQRSAAADSGARTLAPKHSFKLPQLMTGGHRPPLQGPTKHSLKLFYLMILKLEPGFFAPVFGIFVEKLRNLLSMNILHINDILPN